MERPPAKANVANAGPIAIVHVSTSSARIAKRLAGDIIKKDLAIGVSILPTVTTMYKWEEEVVSETETLMIVKTRTPKAEDLLSYVNSIERVPNGENTDNCEIIAMKVENECNPYLDWLADRIPESSAECVSGNSAKKLQDSSNEIEKKTDTLKC